MTERDAMPVRLGTGPTITRRENKCLEDHKVYNYTRAKCSGCEPCGDGQGRDFTNKTNLERGDDGSMICPPCETCPEGSYNNELKAVVCRRCLVDCDEQHRNVQLECSRVNDNVCGSCKKGFEDIYGNVDIPCYEIKPSTPALTTGSTQAAFHIEGRTDYAVGPASAQLPPASGSYQNAEKTTVLAVGLIGGLVILGLLTIFVLYLIVSSRRTSRRRQSMQREAKTFLNGGLISRDHSSTALDMDSYDVLEVDANMYDSTDDHTSTSDDHTSTSDASSGGFAIGDVSMTGERLAGYQRQHSVEGNHFYRVNMQPGVQAGRVNMQPGVQPRPELPGHSVAPTSGPRPELSGTYHTQPEAFRQVLDQLPQQTRQRKICQCSSQPCRYCSGLIDTCSTVKIFKGSVELRKVATNVCHCPVDLYRNLGVSDADIYQIDNDRERDPERIPEKENIIKLLNRWVEIKDKEATLRVLCKALCDSGFHRITELIYVYYCAR